MRLYDARHFFLACALIGHKINAMPSDLIAVIKQKQAEIAKLQGELNEARALLMGGATFAASSSSVRVHGATVSVVRAPGRSGSPRPNGGRDEIVPGSAADLAAKAIRSDGRPLHALTMLKAIEQQTGKKVKLATLVGSLSRWVKKKKYFYRAGRNVFGLIEMRKG